jgi:hypothetical protein
LGIAPGSANIKASLAGISRYIWWC